jgi:hypothetical protein
VGRPLNSQPIQSALPQTQIQNPGQPAGQNGPSLSLNTTMMNTALNEDPAGAAKKEKKREKELYRSLFKNLPGKHDTKRDHYLSDLLMQPPKETRITLLDDSVAEIAFTIFDVPQVIFLYFIWSFSSFSEISILFVCLYRLRHQCTITRLAHGLHWCQTMKFTYTITKRLLTSPFYFHTFYSP